MAMSVPSVGCVLRAVAGSTILVLAGAGSADAQVLSGSLLYTSVQPCRLIDTRVSGAGGPLTAGVSRAFNAVGVASPGSLNTQGGNPSGCPIPGFVGGKPKVQAIAVNFVAVGAAGPGDLIAWPSDQAQPNASILNYANSASLGFLNIANGAILPVRQDAQGGDFTVKAQASGTGLVADVVGFFSKAEPRMYYLTTALFDGSQALTACAAGYHMASLWEIFHTSTLLYNTALGVVENDSGAGPPASTSHSGWIRTGLRSIHANGIPGEDNCDSYTTTTGTGTVVALAPVWNGTPFPISPWFPNDDSCVNSNPVWCVQN
jgi:hypothetical protein